MFSSGKPNYEKLSANLRLAINRLKLLEKKKTEIAIKSRKEIADFIRNGKIERARIRVESIIREDLTVEAMEMVEMYCDLLLSRMAQIKSTNNLDDGIEQPVANLLWATAKLSEVRELNVISSQLEKKYGKTFKQACCSDLFGTINKSLIKKLSVEPPSRLLVEKYLEEVARSYNVPYTP
ncbi:hypothetical protein HELRODRAFT_122553, partial [Helobdella robusta]|uniref:IST1 homolog n=1 Tax=Helobdella robusta TaxID=6412 RepID=T1EGV0_HELRO